MQWMAGPHARRLYRSRHRVANGQPPQPGPDQFLGSSARGAVPKRRSLCSTKTQRRLVGGGGGASARFLLIPHVVFYSSPESRTAAHVFGSVLHLSIFRFVSSCTCYGNIIDAVEQKKKKNIYKSYWFIYLFFCFFYTCSCRTI